MVMVTPPQTFHFLAELSLEDLIGDKSVIQKSDHDGEITKIVIRQEAIRLVIIAEPASNVVMKYLLQNCLRTKDRVSVIYGAITVYRPRRG